MEDALLTVQSEPNKKKLINDLFRAVHTLKGASNLFSYKQVVSFANHIENLLECIRNNSLRLDENLVSILLSSTDHLRLLVKRAIDEEELEQDVKQLNSLLKNSLDHFICDASNIQQVDKQSATDAHPSSVSSHYWHFSIRFETNTFKQNVDPLEFFDYLNSIGTIVHITSIYDLLPDLNQFDPLQCYLGFEIDFETKLARQELEHVFEAINQISYIAMLPPRASISHYSQIIKSLPEDDTRIGELLVSSGALTRKELEDTLRFQSEKQSTPITDNSNIQPLGQLLVEQKLVHPEIISAALDKQAKIKEIEIIDSVSLRIAPAKLDSLVLQIEELMVYWSVNQRSGQIELDQFDNFSESVTKQIIQIRNQAKQLNTTYVKEVFSRFKRLIYESNHKHNKNIVLKTEGEEIRISKSILDKICDPLLHLIRNAIAHGIESSEERLKKGKNSQAIIILKARRVKGEIQIEIQDDGKGISESEIMSRAIKIGIIDKSVNLTSSEILNLIFEPGFTTCQEATNLSGRGVGLDVVRNNIRELHGSIKVFSEENRGTIFQISIPLEKPEAPYLLVNVGESLLLTQQESILDSFPGTAYKNSITDAQGYINHNKEIYPYLRLSNLLPPAQFSNSTSKETEYIIIISKGGINFAIIVNKIINLIDICLAHTSSLELEYLLFDSITVLDTGSIAYVLNLNNLKQIVLDFTEDDSKNKSNNLLRAL